MLLQLEIVQYEASQFIDVTFTSMHGCFIYGSQVTLSSDQNEVFKHLVLQFLLLTANFRKSNRQKIFASLSTFERFDYCVYCGRNVSSEGALGFMQMSHVTLRIYGLLTCSRCQSTQFKSVHPLSPDQSMLSCSVFRQSVQLL